MLHRDPRREKVSAGIAHDDDIVIIDRTDAQHRVVDEGTDAGEQAALPQPTNSTQAIGGPCQPIALGRQMLENEALVVRKLDQFQSGA